MTSMKAPKITPTPIERASARSIIRALIDNYLTSGGDFEEPEGVIAEIRSIAAKLGKERDSILSPAPKQPHKPSKPKAAAVLPVATVIPVPDGLQHTDNAITKRSKR